MKHPFPFRLGSTSYVYPDEILPNVRRLAPIVDDVELVLFEADEYSNLPDAGVVRDLRDVAAEAGLSYTVHLPLDLRLADPGRAGLSLSLEKALRVIDCTHELEPLAYVAHLDGKAELERGPAADWPAWRRRCASALRSLAMECGGAHRICIENLESYPTQEVLPVLDLVPVSLCLDVGHLWLDGGDPEALFLPYQERIKVIHLHGVGERDHLSLRHMPAGQVAELLDLLITSCYHGVVTLEVFSVEDFFNSREMLLEWAGVAEAQPKGRHAGRL